MNNNDFDDLVKKAQEMINNNQVPPEIASMMRNMNLSPNNKVGNNSISNTSDLHNNMSNYSNTNNNQPQKNKQTNSPDIENKNVIFEKNINDDISNLLRALKPYMRDSKKEKIDEYIKLVQMGKVANLFNMLNNNKNT